jgi:hypothetical protein
VLPLAVLAWEADLNLRGAIEQRYVTNLVSHQLLTGAVGSFGARVANPVAAYQLSLSGGYFGAYQLASDPSGASSPHQMSGQLDGSAMWQTSPRTQLSLRTRGLIASELGSSVEVDPATLDVFAGDRLQYTMGQDLQLRAAVSPRTTLSIGAGYGQTGTLGAPGAEPLRIDTHLARSYFRSSFDATAVDQLSAEIGVRYSWYEHAIIDRELRRDRVGSYAGTVMLNETHDFSQNLSGKAGAGVTGVIATDAPAGRSGVFPEGRLEMGYTGATYDASWGYSLAYSSLGPHIGDGQSHAGWLRTSVSPARGRLLRDLTVQGMGRLSYGMTRVGEQTDAGDVQVWSAGASVEVDCPIAARIALTSGVQMELRHLVVEPVMAEGAGGSTSVRLNATVGIRGVLWSHPAEEGQGGK